MKGASRKTKLKWVVRARWRRIVWALKIVELVPPPWRQRMTGKGEVGVRFDVDRGTVFWRDILLVKISGLSRPVSYFNLRPSRSVDELAIA